MAVFVAEPDTAERLPGLVYFHVLPGLNAQHRSMAVHLAAEGYVVAAPDLYHRVGYRTEFDYPREREQAYEARQDHLALRPRRGQPRGAELPA